MSRPVRVLHFFSLLFVIMLLLPNTSFAAPLDFKELVKSAGPSVVNIHTEKIIQRRSSPWPGLDRFPAPPEIERFFEQFDNFGGSSPEKNGLKRTSLGSGFIISADGYIVTNNHVIEGADVIKVSLGDKQKTEEFKAELIGTDPETDLALLKISATHLSFLNFGDSDKLEVGEWVVAIGNPLGLDNTVTAGILSAKGRNIHSTSFDDFLQTDASINPGNSGGPLLNLAGEVIGINTAIARWAQGIGFAIPSNMAKRIINDLKNNRKVTRGFLGVGIQNVDPTMADALGLKKNSGVLIGNVLEGLPAEKAGIKPGDVILSINDTPIEDADHLLRTVALLAPGAKAKVVIWREGKEMSLELTVAERGTNSTNTANNITEILGITTRPLENDEAAKRHRGTMTGVVVSSVAPDGLGARAGIRRGDIILSVNKKPVQTPNELNEQLAGAKKQKKNALLYIARGGNLFFIALDLTEK